MIVIIILCVGLILCADHCGGVVSVSFDCQQGWEPTDDYYSLSVSFEDYYLFSPQDCSVHCSTSDLCQAYYVFANTSRTYHCWMIPSEQVQTARLYLLQSENIKTGAMCTRQAYLNRSVKESLSLSTEISSDATTDINLIETETFTPSEVFPTSLLTTELSTTESFPVNYQSQSNENTEIVLTSDSTTTISSIADSQTAANSQTTSTQTMNLSSISTLSDQETSTLTTEIASTKIISAFETTPTTEASPTTEELPATEEHTSALTTQTSQTVPTSLTTETLPTSPTIETIPTSATETMPTTLTTETMATSQTTETMPTSLTTETMPTSATTETMSISLTTESMPTSATTETFSTTETTPQTMSTSPTTETLSTSTTNQIFSTSNTLPTSVTNQTLSTSTTAQTLPTTTTTTRTMPTPSNNQAVKTSQTATTTATTNYTFPTLFTFQNSGMTWPNWFTSSSVTNGTALTTPTATPSFKKEDFQRIDNSSLWNDAINQCKSFGTQLVVIDSTDKMAFVANSITGMNNTNCYWIDAIKSSVSDDWKNKDGTEMNNELVSTYLQDTISSYPAVLCFGIEKSMVSSSIKWFPYVYSTTKMPYICEKD